MYMPEYKAVEYEIYEHLPQLGVNNFVIVHLSFDSTEIVKKIVNKANRFCPDKKEVYAIVIMYLKHDSCYYKVITDSSVFKWTKLIIKNEKIFDKKLINKLVFNTNEYNIQIPVSVTDWNTNGVAFWNLKRVKYFQIDYDHSGDDLSPEGEGKELYIKRLNYIKYIHDALLEDLPNLEFEHKNLYPDRYVR